MAQNFSFHKKRLFLTLKIFCCSVCLLFCLFSPNLSSADETIFSEANLALPLNDTGVGARALALGSAYTGLADDSAALYWNPGGLGFMDRSELGIHHESDFGGIFRETGILGLPLQSWGGLAASIQYVNDGSIQGRDEFGNPTGNYSAGDLGGSLGWGWKWTRKLGLGISANFTEQTLDDTNYAAYSGGIGALWKPDPHLWFGLDLANLGSSVAGSSQTSSVNAGGSWHFDAGPSNQMLLAMGFKDQLSGTQVLNLGLEDSILSTLALRAGYQYDLSETDLSGLSGVTAGLGLSVAGFSLDYAYLPFGQLGANQTVSLTYRFAPAPRHSSSGRNGSRAARSEDNSSNLVEQIKIYHDKVLRNLSDASAWWTLGNLYNKAKESEKANYCYKKAMKLLPNNTKISGWYYNSFLNKHPEFK
jgi:hypothetical protein